MRQSNEALQQDTGERASALQTSLGGACVGCGHSCYESVLFLSCFSTSRSSFEGLFGGRVLPGLGPARTRLQWRFAAMVAILRNRPMIVCYEKCGFFLVLFVSAVRGARR